MCIACAQHLCIFGLYGGKVQRYRGAGLLRGGWPIRQILGFWGSKVPKVGDSLPRTPLNHRAKIDAASFILAGEIRNRTNKKNKQTYPYNKQIYPHFAYRHVWIINVRKRI